MTIRITNEAGLWPGWMHFLPAPGTDYLSVFAKGTLTITGSGALEPIPLEDQPPPTGELFLDDDREATCLYPGDFVPFKPKTDLTLTATCHAPGGVPAEAVDVRFGLTSATKTLRVTGDRVWTRNVAGLSVPSEPQPFRSMPMVYERALGGPDFEYNPRGIGLDRRADAEGFPEWPLPNIEDPRQPRRSPADQVYPAGFAPLNAEWGERKSRIGTYGPDYAETRWPALAADHDWEYYCCAPAGQRFDGYLAGDETVVVDNLHPDLTRLRIPLPDWRIRCFLVLREGDRAGLQELAMMLDTVHVDMHALQVSLVWRATLQVSSREYPEVERVYLAREALSEPPRPAEEYRSRLLAAIAAENPVVEPEPEPEEPPVPEPPEPDREVMEALEKEAAEALKSARESLNRAELPPETVAALEAETDPQKFLDILMAATEVPQGALDAAVDQEKQRMRSLLEQYGYDPDILDKEEAAPPQPDPSELPPEAVEWTRERVILHGQQGGSYAGENLSGLDLSDVDFGSATFDRAILTGCAFRGCNLRGASLVGAFANAIDLTDAGLEGARLDAASLSNAKAAGARFDGASLTGATFDGADLSGASFRSADLSGALLQGAGLAGSDLREAVATMAVFDRADLTDALLTGADLSQASITEARAPRANFTKANLDRLRAAGVVLTQARLVDVRASYSNFAGGDLREADLSYSVMHRAELSGCDLSGGRFNAVDFSTGIATGGRFRGTQMLASKLFMATFEKADLSGADLGWACLYAAELLDADIRDVTWDQADLGLTRFEHLIDTGLAPA